MSESFNPQDKQDLTILENAVSALREHFDTVHIFATRHEGGGDDHTTFVQAGSGNYYARYGLIKRWLVVEDAGARMDMNP